MTYNERYKVKRLSPEDRRRDAEIAVRKQSRQRPQVRPHYTRPHQEIADDLPDYEDEWEEYTGPLAAVTKRYDTPVAVVPPRRTRVDHYRNDPYFTQAPVAPPKPRRQLQPHWLLYVGVALFFVAIGYVGLTDFSNWWQGHQDDATYGMPRTYQTDAVVGHNDSVQHPSHFTAENLKGLIFVVEYPGGDITKSRVYIITTTNNNDATVPAKVTFQDTRGNGKLDMVVVIGDPGAQVTIIRYNDGSTFDGKP